jgi:hypothetical protein
MMVPDKIREKAEATLVALLTASSKAKLSLDLLKTYWLHKVMEFKKTRFQNIKNSK